MSSLVKCAKGAGSSSRPARAWLPDAPRFFFSPFPHGEVLPSERTCTRGCSGIASDAIASSKTSPSSDTSSPLPPPPKKSYPSASTSSASSSSSSSAPSSSSFFFFFLPWAFLPFLPCAAAFLWVAASLPVWPCALSEAFSSELVDAEESRGLLERRRSRAKSEEREAAPSAVKCEAGSESEAPLRTLPPDLPDLVPAALPPPLSSRNRLPSSGIRSASSLTAASRSSADRAHARSSAASKLAPPPP
mmetsp:Transcript_21437/g.48389  ORF Transcript_21437/g.48389 Transcript_21437/m.48389 type:complete len:247 (-) Transcript_21437:270-1010(-)